MSTQNQNHHLPKYHLLLITTFSLLLRCHTTTDLPVQYYEPDDLQSELFQQWSEKHGTSSKHLTFEGSLKRFENFRRNLKYVVDHNSNQAGFAVGLNRFSDLSNDEFKAGYLIGPSEVKQWVRLNNSCTSSVLTCDAPSYLDWREMGRVSPVKDHGGCGSCGAFSSTNAVEEIDVENKTLHVDRYIHVKQTEAALQCATVNQPISVGIDGSSIDFQLYTGGIYDGACSSNPDDINHVVMIVGYGSEGDKDYWIVKNSWGTSWGMDGYIYIRRNTNLPYGVCSINALASYPLLTTLASSPSPSSSSTPPPASPPYIPPPQPLPPVVAPPPSSPPPPPPSPPPSSPPPPPPSPPPSSPPPPPPPPPPSPTPSSRCGDFTYCLPGQTCCCLYESFGFCLIQGCCRYSKAVCCPESDYCCPLEYPICDTDSGLCLKDSGDKLGIALSKKKWANPTLPWIKLEEITEVTYQPLRWRRNGYAAAG